MTPREFVWLRERHKQEREYQELLVGIQVSTLANHSFSAPKKAYKPYDFMPTKVMEKKMAEDAMTSKNAAKWTRQSFASQLINMRKTMPTVFKVKGEKPKEVRIVETPDGNQTMHVV